MIFKFAQKPVVLDAFTCRPDIYEYSRLRMANDCIPQWWKDLPRTIEYPDLFFPVPTMRSCYGFISQFKHGFFIPLWSDLALEIDKIGGSEDRFQYSDRMSRAQPHPPNERGVFAPLHDYYHLKLVNPWIFQCNEEIVWETVQPAWNMERPETFLTPSGMFDFKNQAAANINLLFAREQEKKRVLLNHGQLMMQVIPLTERKLVVKQHLVSEEEYAKLRGKHVKISFISKFIKSRKAKMRCPFGGDR